MIELTDAQTWTLIVGFLTVIFAMLAVVSTIFIHVLRVEIGALRTEMNAKFEVLDKDIQAIARRVFGEPDA